MGRTVDEVMSASIFFHSGPLAFDPNRRTLGFLQTAMALLHKPRCSQNTPARRQTRSPIPLGDRVGGYDAKCAGEQSCLRARGAR